MIGSYRSRLYVATARGKEKETQRQKESEGGRKKGGRERMEEGRGRGGREGEHGGE